MMMDCPRCGFSQPEDRFCANCGLDVERFVRKPKPFLVRLLQNPNLHLSLLGVLLVLVAGYIFYAQRDRLGRQVGALFNGTPVSSRDAGDRKSEKAHAPEAPSSKHQNDEASEAAKAAAIPVDATDTVQADKAAEAQKIEVSFWEIPRETLSGLITTAEKVAESNEGRAYYWTQGADVAKAVHSSSRRLALSRTIPLQNSAQLSVETPATAAEAFQFGLYFQLSKGEGHDLTVKWESTMVLPPAETAAEAGSQAPVVKALSELSLSGSSPILGQGALMLVLEPTNRALREEYVNKAGEGPWKVFASDAFRAGASDWVVVVQLR